MGGLAHYIEQEGLATTQISLIREHTISIKPPRALWVPFELGRPLGVPNDPDFQTRVLRACLALLDAKSGPVLEDYPEDVPSELSSIDYTGMTCPIALPAQPTDDGATARALLDEIDQVAPWYDLAVNQRGRTTVGVSEVDIADGGRFLAGYLDDDPMDPPRDDVSAGRMLKLVCEDLKAFYSEAASAQPGMATSIAVEHWIFNETVLGNLLWRFRETHADDPDADTRLLARRQLIPDRQIQYRGAPVFEH